MQALCVHVNLTQFWTLAGYAVMAFMSRCCIVLKSSEATCLQSVLLHVVLQGLLQINAVMEHTVKIVETEKCSR